MMKIITKKEFLEINKEPLMGSFVFLNGESCNLCNKYLEKIKTHSDIEWTIVLLHDEHYKWLNKEVGVIGVPMTRIYYDDMVIYEKGGILFDKQINEMKELLKENNL